MFCIKPQQQTTGWPIRLTHVDKFFDTVASGAAVQVKVKCLCPKCKADKS